MRSVENAECGLLLDYFSVHKAKYKNIWEPLSIELSSLVNLRVKTK